jgi:hypothetical protein
VNNFKSSGGLHSGNESGTSIKEKFILIQSSSFGEIKKKKKNFVKKVEKETL